MGEHTGAGGGQQCRGDAGIRNIAAALGSCCHAAPHQLTTTAALRNGDRGVEDDDEDDALALTAAAEAEVAWAAVGGAEEEVAIYKIMDLNNTRVQL